MSTRGKTEDIINKIDIKVFECPFDSLPLQLEIRCYMLTAEIAYIHIHMRDVIYQPSDCLFSKDNRIGQENLTLIFSFNYV